MPPVSKMGGGNLFQNVVYMLVCVYMRVCVFVCVTSCFVDQDF